MKVIAAYLLATLGGNQSPSADDVKAILKSVGATAEDDRIASLISELKGKNLQQIMDAGKAKLSTVPSGGSSTTAPKKEEAKKEEKKPEPKKEEKKKDEPKPESDQDIGLGLFGGDD